MSEVGIVIYRKSERSGTLEAEFYHPQTGSGTGEATGGPDEGFVGHYTIRYRYDSGRPDDVRQLEIQRAADHFVLLWKHDDIVRAKGVGRMVGDQLAAGWGDI